MASFVKDGCLPNSPLGSVTTCTGLTLAGCQAYTKATVSLPSTAGQGRENIKDSSWIEIRTGRDCSSNNVMGKTGWN